MTGSRGILEIVAMACCLSRQVCFSITPIRLFSLTFLAPIMIGFLMKVAERHLNFSHSKF